MSYVRRGRATSSTSRTACGSTASPPLCSPGDALQAQRQVPRADLLCDVHRTPSTSRVSVWQDRDHRTGLRCCAQHPKRAQQVPQEGSTSYRPAAIQGSPLIIAETHSVALQKGAVVDVSVPSRTSSACLRFVGVFTTSTAGRLGQLPTSCHPRISADHRRKNSVAL